MSSLAPTMAPTEEGEDAPLGLTIFVQSLLWFLVFGLAGSVDFDAFKARFKSKGIYIGLCCQFILMPPLGFVTVAIFSLEPLYALILLIIVSSPGGSYSNWWCNLFNADLALSVAMTCVSTIFSIGMLPFNIWLYVNTLFPKVYDGSEEVELDFAALGMTLGVVVSGILAGLFFGYNYPQYMDPMNKFANLCGMLSILVGVFVSSNSEGGKPWAQDFNVYIASFLPLGVGLIAAYGIATFFDLPKPQRVAVAIETAYQNTGIALTIAISLGDEGANAAVVAVIYGGYEAVCFGMFAFTMWKLGHTLAPHDDRLWDVLNTNYQHTIEDHHHYAPKEHRERIKAENRMKRAQQTNREMVPTPNARQEMGVPPGMPPQPSFWQRMSARMPWGSPLPQQQMPMQQMQQQQPQQFGGPQVMP